MWEREIPRAAREATFLGIASAAPAEGAKRQARGEEDVVRGE